MPHPDITDEIGKVQAYITGAEASVNALRIYPRTMARYPFDTVALETVSKAFALSKACLTLLKSDFPDEGFGLSRSLVECAMNLRYMTQDPAKLGARTDEFISYIKADKGYWMHYALESGPTAEKERKIKERGRDLGVGPDPKSARRHWSGQGGFVWEIAAKDHPLDSPVDSQRSRKSEYAVAYHHTSSFVHCSQPALDNYYPDERTPYSVSPSSGDYYQRGEVTLFLVLSYLHSVIAYALFGMNTERPQDLDSLFGESLESLKPYKPKYS
jgi:Family of unknown function (DUF5677)